MTILSTGVATEFINFTRASNATVTDSNGLIDWAPHNLLTNSESFDNASGWSVQRGTVTVNNAAAPNGTTTAEKFTEDNTANTRSVISLSSIAVPQATAGIFLKDGATNGRRYVSLTFTDASTGANGFLATFDLVNGTWTRQLVGTGSLPDVTMTSLGSGWYYCAISGVATSTSAMSYVVSPATSATPTVGGTFGREVYTGDNTKNFLLWGAACYRSDLGMQANTSAYPMYNPTTPKNLLGYTENFDNAAWTKTSATVSADSLSAPNGLNTSDTLTASAGTVFPQVLQATPAYATAQMVSVYAKAGTYGILQLFNAYGAAHYANFNLSAGVVGTKGASVSDSGMVALGNGWYRCWAYFAALDDVGIGMAGSTSATKQATWATTGSETIYLWGAQLSDSASLDPYAPNHFAAPSAAAYYGPRRDFDSAGVCRGLLVEEQRTNSLLHSAAFDNATWTNAAPDTPTVTANNLVAPDGTTTGDLLTAATGGIASQVRQSITATGALAYTFSVFIKQGTSTQSRILIRDNTNGTNFIQSTAITWSSGVPVIGGTTGTWATPVSVGNGWWRIAGTGTAGAGASVNVLVSVYPDNSAGTGTLGVWGAQLEAGSFATSYIPTGAATATRNADVASVSTQAFPYSATEGTVVANYSTISPVGSARIVALGLPSYSTYLDISNSTSVASWNGSVNLVSASGASTVGPVKSGIAYSGTGRSLVHAGGTATTDANTFLPNNALYLGSAHVPNTYVLNGHIRQITYLPRRISNTELQSRTA